MKQPLAIQFAEGLNVGTLFVILLLFQIFRKVQRDFSIKCDDRTISAGDFTVLIKGFKLSKTTGHIDADDEIQTWAEENFKCKIKKVNVCWNIQKYEVLHQKKDETIDKIQNLKTLQHKGIEISEQEIDLLNSDIQKLVADMDRLEQNFKEGTEIDSFIGKAFITF